MKFNKFIIAFGITAQIGSVVDAKKNQFKDDDDGDDDTRLDKRIKSEHMNACWLTGVARQYD